MMRLPGIVYRPIVGLEPSEVAIAYRKDDDEPAVRALLQIAVEKMPSKTAPSSASARRRSARSKRFQSTAARTKQVRLLTTSLLASPCLTVSTGEESRPPIQGRLSSQRAVTPR